MQMRDEWRLRTTDRFLEQILCKIVLVKQSIDQPEAVKTRHHHVGQPRSRSSRIRERAALYPLS